VATGFVRSKFLSFLSCVREAVSTPYPLNAQFTLVGLSFVRIRNPLYVSPSALEVVLFPLDSVLQVFVHKDLDAIVARPVGVTVHEDFDFLKPFFGNLRVVFQGTVYRFRKY